MVKKYGFFVKYDDLYKGPFHTLKECMICDDYKERIYHGDLIENDDKTIDSSKLGRVNLL